MGLNEAADIQRFGGFRPDPTGRSLEDKWFATSLTDAIAFGRQLQRLLSRPRPFVVAELAVPVSLLRVLHYNPRLDRIGPAYLVPRDQLAELNRLAHITLHATVFASPD